MVTQNEFKVISQQIVAQVGKEAKKLEGDKMRLTAALKKSEETCAKVNEISKSHIYIPILLIFTKVVGGAVKLEG